MKKNGISRRVASKRSIATPFPSTGGEEMSLTHLLTALTALKKGDFSIRLPLDWDGKAGKIADAFNDVVERNQRMATELERMSRMVGKEGKISQRASIGEVSGSWADSIDSVNLMAGNLTNQVRGIALVVTAVANGNLKQKLNVEAKGEIAALADTINGMTDTLAIFADLVTSVAREVGVEGKLGGQASVPGAAGTWKDLTDNVNQLAANLTTQVRAIAEVATAVTKGDLTRSITVEALGEVAALKDNINEMIRNLKDTTLKNSEQDWLKTNLAKFSRMLQGQKDLLAVGKLILSELAPVVSAQQGVFYTIDSAKEEGEPYLKLLASYAYRDRKGTGTTFKLGEGLVGQCAVEKEKILITNAPRNYMTIGSGLGKASPVNILVLPVVFEGQVKGVMELASFDRFSATHHAFLDQLTESIGIVFNTIEANTRTEDLLKQSQSLAKELQSQQLELQQTNQQLGEKAKLLADQNVEVERKNTEVEQARQALEEKAKQLALTSKYKSEFLANMSHELRTPLNSLLILSNDLSKNKEQNLSGKQVEFAKTIHAAGNDLLALINDILDLSKIESGTVMVDVGEVTLRELQDYVERGFRHFADSKKLEFDVMRSVDLPRTIQTDAKRLQQILKNLLSNAFKFTESGRVSLSIETALDGWNPENETLNRAKSVLVFSVTDTGIGISPDKQHIIFEAFQQADASTSRKYGGTGLGLAISREITRLLGGEIRLASTPGEGSTFTLFLPQNYVPVKPAKRQALLPSGQNRMEIPIDLEIPLPTPEPEPIDAVTFDDDSDNILPEDRVLLIVENDTGFAQLLMEVAQENNFKALISSRGDHALTLVGQRRVDAITLDINLNDIDGWRVLARLKDNINTRHIPTYLITTEEAQTLGLRLGALGVLHKPLKSKEAIREIFLRFNHVLGASPRQLLVAGREARELDHLQHLLKADGVEITGVKTGKEVLEKLRDNVFSAAIVNLDLEDMTGLDLMEEIKKDPHLENIPLIAYVPRNPSKKEDAHLKRLGHAMNLKEVHSEERLIDESALFLHQNISRLPENKREIIHHLYQAETVLKDKKILIVDDDIRNIFAMTSLLERYDMQTFSAETGKIALEQLQATPEIDAVLMDIMMPDVDGYDTMRAIRKFPKFRTLPMIAVTAKAMKGDREKCIEAGASDYIAKPMDTAELLSMLRLWIHR